MTFPFSDFLGMVAGALLAIPPLKDQYYRYREYRERMRARWARWPELRHLLAGAWSEERQAYSGWDTLCLAGGAVALLMSFVVKLRYG